MSIHKSFKSEIFILFSLYKKTHYSKGAFCSFYDVVFKIFKMYVLIAFYLISFTAIIADFMPILKLASF